VSDVALGNLITAHTSSRTIIATQVVCDYINFIMILSFLLNIAVNVGKVFLGFAVMFGAFAMFIVPLRKYMKRTLKKSREAGPTRIFHWSRDSVDVSSAYEHQSEMEILHQPLDREQDSLLVMGRTLSPPSIAPLTESMGNIHNRSHTNSLVTINSCCVVVLCIFAL
jgi:hypothetical protein